MAEDAVCREPFSTECPDNPRFTGKKREKTGNPRLSVGYSHTLSIIYGKIPYAMEQGILDNDQGMRTREQGMHLLVQEIAHWFGRRFESGAGFEPATADRRVGGLA